MIQSIIEVINNQKGIDFIENLRQNFENWYLKHLALVNVKSCKEAIERAVEVIQNAYTVLFRIGAETSKIDPGHSTGHLARTLANTYRLAYTVDIDPRQLFVGMVAGAMPIGGFILPRYEEKKRIVRSAEASALLLNEVLAGVNCSERLLTLYAAAARTHYLKPESVELGGVQHVINPYLDVWPDDDGNFQPIWAIWFVRWLARLENLGAVFVGRHYLAQAGEHVDFDGTGFCEQRFEEVMRPFFKGEENCETHTMLAHLKMFAASQSQRTSYGNHDLPGMIQLRYWGRRDLEAIIDSILEAKKHGIVYEPKEEEKILIKWTSLLYGNIEPSSTGTLAACLLKARFGSLPDWRAAWIRGFKEAMERYRDWSNEMICFLNSLPEGWLTIPGITNDIRDIIRMRL